MLSFDGRVLEVFGGSVRRFRVKLPSVTVSGPDGTGNRNVALKQAGVEIVVSGDTARRVARTKAGDLESSLSIARIGMFIEETSRHER